MNDIVKLTNYDAIADTYIPHAEDEKSWNNLYERPYMLSIFDDFSGKNVLDVGCGTGYYSFYALGKKARVTAIDASQKMLDYIKKHDPSHEITVHCGDITQGLPFIESNTQDYIICSLVIHYSEKWETIINDFYRVLKQGGKVYISTHHPFLDYLVLDKKSYFDKYLVHDTWQTKNGSFDVHYYTRSLTDVLKPIFNSGFTIINMEEPLPGSKCKELAPNVYQRLLEKPAFLFITLQK